MRAPQTAHMQAMLNTLTTDKGGAVHHHTKGVESNILIGSVPDLHSVHIGCINVMN